MGTSRLVIVSPHFDDAVFSASLQIMNSQVLVLTIFAGLPEPHQPLGDWDRLTRAVNGRTRLLEREAEDDEALSRLGARAARMAERDVEYRSTEIDKNALTRALRPFLADSDEIWLPAAIGCHPDHIIARDVGLRCIAELGQGQCVHLYADLPYAIEYGWPSWVDADSQRPFADSDWFIESELRNAGLDNLDLKPTVWRLSNDERDLKYLAVSAYRTQLAALGMDDLQDGRSDRLWRYEASWAVDSGSLPRAIDPLI